VPAAELARRTAEIEAALARKPAAWPKVLATSARKGQGLDEVRRLLAGLLETG
jgi:GTP-binding protein